jgi:hypothetical protein
MFPVEFEFTLPKGYLDSDGNLHREGIMRLATAIDEISPLRDPRVKSNSAYATIIIISRVIVRLGALDEVTPTIVENFFAQDLNYLQNLYRKINGMETDPTPTETKETPKRLGKSEAKPTTRTTKKT